MDIETRDQILGPHSSDAMPYLFIDSFGRGLIETLPHKNEPEGIDHPIMPEQKLEISTELLVSMFSKTCKSIALPPFVTGKSAGCPALCLPVRKAGAGTFS